MEYEAYLRELDGEEGDDYSMDESDEGDWQVLFPAQPLKLEFD